MFGTVALGNFQVNLLPLLIGVVFNVVCNKNVHYCNGVCIVTADDFIE